MLVPLKRKKESKLNINRKDASSNKTYHDACLSHKANFWFPFVELNILKEMLLLHTKTIVLKV